MYKNNQFNQFDSRNLRINGRCPVCNSMYDIQKIRILGEKDQSVLVYIECPFCGASVVSILSLGQMGMQAQGMVTDLTVDEIMTQDPDQEINSDDVLEIHSLLENDENILTI